MLYRLVACAGWVAHVVDAIYANRRRERPRPQPYAGQARFGVVLVIAALAAFVAALAIVNALEAASNSTATEYTVDQLVDNPNIGSHIYATVTGTAYDWFVVSTKNGNSGHAAFLIGDKATDKWMIVQTSNSAADFEAMIGPDRRVTVTGMLRNDRTEIDAVLSEPGTNVPSVNITNAIILNQGETPANSILMAAIAAVAILVAAVLFLGWWVKFMPFRPLKARATMGTNGLVSPIGAKATGVIPRTVGGYRAYQLVSQLQPVAADPAHPERSPLDLVWRDGQGITGVRLLPGITEAAMGTAYTPRQKLPAIVLRFQGCRVILAFADEALRDQAFDHLRHSNELQTTPERSTARAS